MIFTPLANTLLTLKVYLEVWFAGDGVPGISFGGHKHKQEDFHMVVVLQLQK